MWLLCLASSSSSYFTNDRTGEEGLHLLARISLLNLKCKLSLRDAHLDIGAIDDDVEREEEVETATRVQMPSVAPPAS